MTDSPSDRGLGLYLAIVLIFHLFVALRGYWTCKAWNDGDHGYLQGLAPGWVPGRSIDLSDTQYRTWRKFFPSVITFAAVFLGVSATVKRLTASQSGGASPYLAPKWEQEVARGVGHVSPPLVRGRLAVYLCMSAAFFIVIHGSECIWLVAILVINYAIGRVFGASRLNPLLTWLFNLVVLISCDWFHGYSFSALSPSLFILDRRHGLLRWHVSFGLCMLRLISFNFDYYWMLHARPPPLNGASEYRRRQNTSLPHACYSFVPYAAYVLYVPLYIAGPITTFNAFYSYVLWPQAAVPLKAIGGQVVRTLAYMLALDVFLHFYYYYAFNEGGYWTYLPPVEIGITGYLTLAFMYTKFLTIWRFFRLWAMLDGIETPENMPHCWANNCTFTSFWRSWHASFNQWIIRYLYVPLGGRKYQVVTVWIIFLFVGVWHDVEWRWVTWALFNCLFFSFEIRVFAVFRSPKYERLRRSRWYTHMCAAGGTLNTPLLMIANLAIMHGFRNSLRFLARLSSPPAQAAATWVVGLVFFFSAHLVSAVRRRRLESDLKHR